MSYPEFQSQEVIFDQKWAGTIIKELYRLSDGRIFDFYRFHGCDCTSILVLTPENTCVLTTEYRYGVNDYMTSLCGGRVEEGESPRQAALREMQEETGYTTQENDFLFLSETYVSAGRGQNKRYTYLARNAYMDREQDLDPYESITVKHEPYNQVKEKIKANVYQETGLHVAFLYYEVFCK